MRNVSIFVVLICLAPHINAMTPPLWSIKDSYNPPADPPSVHPLMSSALYVADKVWSILPGQAQSLVWYYICPADEQCPENEKLSGDFSSLNDKGIFRFLLDELQHQVPSAKKPWISFRLASVPMILITDHALANKILLSHKVIRKLSYQRLREFFGDGIFTSQDYDRWHHQRHIGMALLHGPSLKRMAAPMYEGLVKELARACDNARGEPIDLVLLLSRIGLFAFCDSVLKVDVRDIADPLAPRINRLLSYINGALEPVSIPFGQAYNSFIEDRDFVHDWMRTLVQRVRANAAQGVVPDNLLVEEILALETPEREQELIELMISMVLGGHETTARMMLGAFYFLMKHPAYIEQIRGETECFLGLGEGMLGYDAVMKSPYFNRLRTVVDEAIRLTPPVWLLARTLTEDLHYSDEVVIPKGTEILISPLFLQRQESVYGKNAEVFFPERFDDLPDDIRKKHKPFIDGLYKCPGQYFAKMEAALAIAGLFQFFDMKLLNQEELPKPMSAGTFRLFSELMVVIRERRL